MVAGIVLRPWLRPYVPQGTKKIGKQVTQQDCVLPVEYMIETSSDLLWLSSAIFEKCSEMFENVRKRSSGLRNNFGKSSEIFGKWSETFTKSPKTSSLQVVCLYNEQNNTSLLVDMEFLNCVQLDISRP